MMRKDNFFYFPEIEFSLIVRFFFNKTNNVPFSSDYSKQILLMVQPFANTYICRVGLLNKCRLFTCLYFTSHFIKLSQTNI